MGEKFGINISGYINKAFGLGVAVRANINSVKASEIPYSINDFNIKISNSIGSVSSNFEFSEENPYNINLVQINPDKLNEVFATVSTKYFQNKYNIAFWAWELENFPDESKSFLSLFHEIWVPSNFCTEAISKVSHKPVIKIMHSISIDSVPYTRKDFNLPEDKFIFMTMFDYHSSMERKNPIATIDSYEKTFGTNHTDTILIIKTSISTEFPEQKQKLIERVGQNESIIIVEELLDQERLYSLMNCCDCFVSLHRSEGFGLTMAEAMYLGKPVIATAYSANIEFMNINNSFLVKYNLIKTKDQYYSSSNEDIWADPDIEHASEHMTFVYQNKALSLIIANKGKEDVNFFLSPKKIGKKIKQRLEIINDEIFPKLSEDVSNEQSLLKLEIKFLKEKLDMVKKLNVVQWKIKFKNLQNKISGKKRKYFWE
ncbi:MAG: glycosyltransferase family 1 protein [Flavobacterium sp.]|nr:MAG: glycosyltransferase family 1 protein [Flavobacterium sp.]